MIQVYKRMQKMREKYVDTLAKLYEYATTVSGNFWGRIKGSK